MFKGKALLVIDRLEANRATDFHWDINVFQQSLNGDDPGGEVNEAFNCAEWDSLPAPAAAYKMQIGDRIRVLVHYEIHFSYDEWSGEHDMELYFERERVLRRQPYCDKKHRKNFYNLWKETQQTSI
jgi:hypothetical protein